MGPRPRRRAWPAAATALRLAAAISLVLLPSTARAQAAPPEPAAGQPTGPAPAAPTRTPSSGQDEQAVTQGVPRFTPPRLVERVDAAYPPEALAQDLEAVVVLELSLDEKGEVVAVAVKEPAGHGFDEAAVAAARRFRFEPARNDGSPVPSRVTYRYGFRLRKVSRPASPAGTPAAPQDGTGGPPPAVPAGSLTGRVLARGTRAPLASAHIAAEHEEAAPGPEAPRRYEADTDDHGAFALEGLEPGRYRVLVSGAGAERTTFHEALGRDQRLAVVYYVNKPFGARYESTVRGAAVREEVSRQTLTTEELVKLPGTFGDALRAVENLPGVARAPFNTGLIIVRGGKPSDSRSFLAGAEVPQLYHFGGFTSVLPSSLLERVDYYPGNFPVRFGRATAGAIEVELREGKRDRLHGYVDVNGFDGGASVEGPVGKGSFILAARRSYIDSILAVAGGAALSLVGAKGLAFTTAPVYYDYQGVLDYPVGGGKLRVMVYGSDDLLKLVFDNPQTADPGLAGTFSTHILFHKLQLRFSKTSGAWTWFVQTSAGYSGQEGALGNGRNFAARVLGDDSRLEARYHFSKNLRLTLGADAQLSWVQLDANVPAAVREGEQPLPLSVVNTVAAHEQIVSFSIGLYGELMARLTSRLTVTPGLRFDYYGSIRRVTLDPRLGVRYQLTPITVLKAGVGLFSQDPQPPDYDKAFGNPRLRPENAIHYALSVEQGIWPGLMFEATGFYKTLYDLVVTSTRTVWVDGARQAERAANDGEGRVYGGEFLLRQSISKWFFGWISYTLMRSERRDCATCAWRAFDYDQTHVLVVALHAYLPRGWEVGTRFRYISGNPVTVVRGATYDADADVYVPGRYPTNAERLDAFHQLDVRVDKTFTFDRWVLKLYLDLTNVYNRQNPEQLQYSFDYKRSTTLTGLPFIPSFGVRGEL